MHPARDAGTRILRDTSGPTEQRLSAPSAVGMGSVFSVLSDIVIVGSSDLRSEGHMLVIASVAGTRTALPPKHCLDGVCLPSDGEPFYQLYVDACSRRCFATPRLEVKSSRKQT